MAPALKRELGFWQCAGLVVGTIIGTGVFLKAAVMSQLGGSPAWVLAAWAVGGALALIGALTYAELGGMFHGSGGEYVYLRESYGKLFAFLYGWMRFWIGSPGSIAAYAVGAATFLSTLLPMDAMGGTPGFAVGMIVVFTAIGCLKVRVGGGLQLGLTALKVVLILGLAAGIFISRSGSWQNLATPPGAGFPGWSTFGLMVLAALWAYDGFNNLPMAAGEVRDPERNLPRALVLGSLAVLAIYALIHVAYFYALPFDEIESANSTLTPRAPAVAAKAAATFLGGTAQGVVAFGMALSALSAMNGAILTGARVPYAVAADGLAPRSLAQLNHAGVPMRAVLLQGACSCVLALTGRFDQLTNSVVFASWLFYALNASAVIHLRRRRPELPRPYRVPGYPVVPAVFVLVGALLLVNTVVSSPADSALGLGLIALSLPFYLWMKRYRS